MSDAILGASGYIVPPSIDERIADPFFVASVTGKIGGLPAVIWPIFGRRNAFIDTTTLHDVVDFSGTDEDQGQRDRSVSRRNTSR